MTKALENYNRWLESPNVDEADKNELRGMTPEQIDDAFFQSIQFGTGGMRGIIGPGTNRINKLTIKRATIAYGKFLLANASSSKGKGVVISHDNRHHSRDYALYVAKILNQMGIKAYIFDGLRPTPELSFAVRELHAAGGIMLTASHNPKEYNGYKVYDEKGCQLVPQAMKPMLEILASLPEETEVEVEKAKTPGATEMLNDDVDKAYREKVMGCQLNPDLDKSDFKIVFTPNHGASLENAVKIFKDCGYNIIPVPAQWVHDPDFSGTLSPNPEMAESFIEPIKVAKEADADLVVMTDPDGDRCGLAYKGKNGEFITLTGNQSGALLIDYVLENRKKRGILHENGVLFDTIVTSSLGRKVADSYGVKTESFLTGFKYIGERIGIYEDDESAPTFEFGYEESYGCLLKDFSRDKDGTQAILLYSEMALFYHNKGMDLGEALDALYRKYGYHDTVTESVMFKGSVGLAKMNELMEELRNNPPKKVLKMKVVRVEDYLNSKAFTVKGKKEEPILLPSSNVVKLIFDDGSWLAARPSGTEPKCKFYSEAIAKDAAEAKKKAFEIVRTIREYLKIE